MHPGQVIKRREETLLWFQTSSLFLPKRNKHLFWVSGRGRLFLLRKYTFLLKPSTHLFPSGQPQNHFTSLSSPVSRMYYNIYSKIFRGDTDLLYQLISIYSAFKDIVQPKIKFLLLFTRSHVIPNHTLTKGDFFFCEIWIIH